ncbi:MAG: hypothetical protein CSB46_11305 [Micrococcales bacterium]|nr:MAG: hypothetical protein CSB46_11305 [Micrococcales bacterium]
MNQNASQLFPALALGLGVLSVIGCCFPGMWYVGILLGIGAIVLGFMGRSRVKKGTATGGGLALAGIIIGSIGLVLSIVMAVFAAVVDDCLDYANDRERFEQCITDKFGG